VDEAADEDFGDFDAAPADTPDPFDAFDDLDAPAAPPAAASPEPAAADTMVTPGAPAPKEDFRAYDVDTPARPSAEAAPPEPPAEDEWSAFADAPQGGESEAPAAEAEDFGDFDAAPPADAPPATPAPEEDPWDAFDAITPADSAAPVEDAPAAPRLDDAAGSVAGQSTDGTCGGGAPPTPCSASWTATGVCGARRGVLVCPASAWLAA